MQTPRFETQPEGRLPRSTAMLLITGLIVLIATSDMALASQYNLGALYMIPFIVATQYVRRSTRLLLLALALVILNYFGLLMAYLPHFSPDTQLRYRLVNRGFVAAALTGAAILVVFYLRARNYWLLRQAQMAPTDEEVSLLLQVFQMFEDIVAVIVAMALAAVTFAVDFFTPPFMNLPILYLIPLAIVAITRSRWLLWSAVPILLALSYVGFFYGPDPHMDASIARRAVVNRQLSSGAIIAAAALFHIAASPKGRSQRSVPTPPARK